MSYLDKLQNEMTRALTTDEQGVYNAMRENPAYTNWRDEELRAFVGNAGDWGTATGAGEKFYMEQAVARRQANREASQDRAEILADLKAWRAGFNEDWIAQGVSQEKAYWDEKARQMREQVIEQYAAMGRVPDPLVLKEALRRVAVEASTAMQLTRMRLEQEQNDRTGQYLQLKNNVFQNTQRAVVDPVEAAQIAMELGKAGA
jgi:hypothetical protein